MPFLYTILMLANPLLLLTGMTLLNWVFQPPFSGNIDFILMLILFGSFIYIVSQLLAVVYGVDTL